MKQRILRQHLFDEVERARQELYFQEQQQRLQENHFVKKDVTPSAPAGPAYFSKELLATKIKRNSEKRLQEENNNNKILDLSHQQFTPTPPVDADGGKHLQHQHHHNHLETSAMFYHYLHQQPPPPPLPVLTASHFVNHPYPPPAVHHHYHQLPVTVSPVYNKAVKIQPKVIKVERRVSSVPKKAPVNVVESKPAAKVHGVDRKGHNYLEGEYFCVCGLEFPGKDKLFEHIREMCKSPGTLISCHITFMEAS